MNRIRAWAVKKRSHNTYVSQPNIRFYDPIKAALFKTQRDAWEFMKNQNMPIETYTPVKVFIDIKEG